MFCTECGTQLKENQSFCTNCGSAVEITSPARAEQPHVPAPPSAMPSQQVPSVEQKTPELETQTRQTALLLHLSLLAGFIIPLAGLIAPILIWQMKKDELPLIDAHGKNAVNWIVSSLIYGVVCFILCFLLIGIPLSIALGVLSIVFPIMAAIKGNKGEVWKYPLAISFFR